MSPALPKNPRTPQVPLTLPADAIFQWSKFVWRIHTTAGPHPLAWNELRWTGPIRSMRWDPHPGPLGETSNVGESYVAPDFATCFFEVFQANRKIALTPDRALSGWRPTRPLELLNILGGEDTGDWAAKHGASVSLPQASKSTCRAWAGAVYEQLGDWIDRLLVSSTVLGDASVVLFARAASAFPTASTFSRTLEHDAVRVMAVKVSDRLNWPIR